MLKKRSFAIARHRTSVALEEEFWRVLEADARRKGLSLSALVATVDSSRGSRPLASALRLLALAAAADTTLTREAGYGRKVILET